MIAAGISAGGGAAAPTMQHFAQSVQDAGECGIEAGLAVSAFAAGWACRCVCGSGE